MPINSGTPNFILEISSRLRFGSTIPIDAAVRRASRFLDMSTDATLGVPSSRTLMLPMVPNTLLSSPSVRGLMTTFASYSLTWRVSLLAVPSSMSDLVSLRSSRLLFPHSGCGEYVCRDALPVGVYGELFSF
jgi:hypothetical protein